jgi:hypothetical protein
MQQGVKAWMKTQCQDGENQHKHTQCGASNEQDAPTLVCKDPGTKTNRGVEGTERNEHEFYRGTIEGNS